MLLTLIGGVLHEMNEILSPFEFYFNDVLASTKPSGLLCEFRLIGWSVVKRNCCSIRLLHNNFVRVAERFNVELIITQTAFGCNKAHL